MDGTVAPLVTVSLVIDQTVNKNVYLCDDDDSVIFKMFSNTHKMATAVICPLHTQGAPVQEEELILPHITDLLV